MAAGGAALVDPSTLVGSPCQPSSGRRGRELKMDMTSADVRDIMELLSDGAKRLLDALLKEDPLGEAGQYETLDYLAALLPPDAPPIHRERLRVIRRQIKRGQGIRCCNDFEQSPAELRALMPWIDWTPNEERMKKRREGT